MTVAPNPQAASDQARAAYSKITDQLANLGLDTAVPQGRTFDAAGQGAVAFNRKIVDLVRRNVDASFDLATSLAGARTLPTWLDCKRPFGASSLAH